jgi:hypothetical protein
VTPDPIGMEGGIDLFVYVKNNPVNFIDPFGLMACSPPECKNPRPIRTWQEEDPSRGSMWGNTPCNSGRWECTEYLCDDGRTIVERRCIWSTSGGIRG